MTRFKQLIPNLLSVLRLFLVLPFIQAISRDRKAELLAIVILIVVTDFFDGYLARSWNAITETGKILDPLADKVCTAVAAVALVYLRGLPVWLVLMVIARDIIIMVAGLILIRLRNIIPVSDFIGKMAMVIMTICLLVYLFNIRLIEQPMVIVTAAALVASLISYGRIFFRILRQKAA